MAGKYGKEWRKWSCEQYRDDVNLVSHALLSMGLKKGDKVATITGNCPEWNLVDMALSQSGMIHVPVYPTIGSEVSMNIF
ncbi:MAG: AMP-binding protein [Bacteroidales bacterium]